MNFGKFSFLSQAITGKYSCDVISNQFFFDEKYLEKISSGNVFSYVSPYMMYFT